VPVEISVQKSLQGERALVAIHRDISERKQMLRDMVRIVGGAPRSAKHLHDTIGQELNGHHVTGGALCASLNCRVAEREKIVADVLEICRDTPASSGISCPACCPERGGDVVGGTPALDPQHQGSGWCCVRTVRAVGAPVEDIHTESHLFQIAQEATANAVRHAAPRPSASPLKRTAYKASW
jgi:hypothetical protein